MALIMPEVMGVVSWCAGSSGMELHRCGMGAFLKVQTLGHHSRFLHQNRGIGPGNLHFTKAALMIAEPIEVYDLLP